MRGVGSATPLANEAMKPRTFVIGDVHGDLPALERMLNAIGVGPSTDPVHLQIVFVGDLVDRGPFSIPCLERAFSLMDRGLARIVMGNHEVRLLAMLRTALSRRIPGRLPPSRVPTWSQVVALARDELEEMEERVSALPAFVEPRPGTVVAHAYWSPDVRELDEDAATRMCAFGPPGPASGGPRGVPSRAVWTTAYQGDEQVFWGHQVCRPKEVVVRGNTTNVESGCFEGHPLSAVDIDSGEVVQVESSGHWKDLMRGRMNIEEVLYPRALRDVRETIERERIGSLDSYLAWVRKKAAKQRVELHPTELQHHRRLFRTATAEAPRPRPLTRTAG